MNVYPLNLFLRVVAYDGRTLDEDTKAFCVEASMLIRKIWAIEGRPPVRPDFTVLPPEGEMPGYVGYICAGVSRLWCWRKGGGWGP